LFCQAYESSLQQQPTAVQTLPQTELSQSPDLLRHIPPTAIPASRLVSSDQLPRRASARNPPSGTGATPTISCPYYKSELYIVSEEQAFRSQPGRPFRNDDVADCIAIASSTPPSVVVPHRSYLRSPDVTVAGLAPGSNVSSRQSEFVMRHSYGGSVSPSSSSSAAASASSVQRDWPTSTSRRSLTESKWKWLHSNAMMPEPPSPVSLRRATQLDIPLSTGLLSSSPLRQDFRQQSAGNLTMSSSQNLSDSRLADTQGQIPASRLYYSKPVVDRTSEHTPRRKTTMDLIQSVSDVHRSVDDPSVRHWRHSSDNTARRSTADSSSHKWDNYGLTVSLSGAAVPPSSGKLLESDVIKPDLDRNTNNGHATSSSSDLPNKLPIERIMRFDNAVLPSSARHPKDTATAMPSQNVTSRNARYEADSASGANASPPPVAQPGRAGRMSVPDSIPIYFRAEPSARQSQPGSSNTETKAGRSESITLTDGRQQPSSITSSHSTSMYILLLSSLSIVCIICLTACNSMLI